MRRVGRLRRRGTLRRRIRLAWPTTVTSLNTQVITVAQVGLVIVVVENPG